MTQKIIQALFVALLTTMTARSEPLGIMVAPYFSPATAAGAEYWKALNYAASRVPLIAIVNPNSGPGASQSSNYITALANLHAAGGKAIGYVSSDYARRPMADVKADIDKYLAWYAVDGFFIDEMTNDSKTNHLEHYAEIYDYIKNKGKHLNVTGNPGANTHESYLAKPTADILMIFESGSDKYAGYQAPKWVANHSAGHFAHLPYGVAGLEKLTNYVSLAVSQNAGWIYISDLTTYSKLPTYWTNEVQLVQSLNAAKTAGP